MKTRIAFSSLISLLLYSATSLFFLLPSTSHALVIPGDADLASLVAYAACREEGGTRLKCTGVALVVDPPAPGITSISMTLGYDPGKWTFNDSKSGYLCDFSKNGACPPPTAGVGTSKLEQLMFEAGSPLDGSTSTFTDNGNSVTIDYILQSPISSTSEQNFLMLFFESATPFDLASASATYFSNSAGSDFTQHSFSCSTTTQSGCGSKTPISGLIITVPEPEIASLLALILFVLSRLKRLHS